jgi:hypothetical protein
MPPFHGRRPGLSPSIELVPAGTHHAGSSVDRWNGGDSDYLTVCMVVFVPPASHAFTEEGSPADVGVLREKKKTWFGGVRVLIEDLIGIGSVWEPASNTHVYKYNSLRSV